MLKKLSMLDFLDEIDEKKIEVDKKTHRKFICKVCDKTLYNKKMFQIHKEDCYEKKIDFLTNELIIQKDDIIHGLRIYFLEQLIEHNNNKWNKIYSK